MSKLKSYVWLDNLFFGWIQKGGTNAYSHQLHPKNGVEIQIISSELDSEIK